MVNWLHNRQLRGFYKEAKMANTIKIVDTILSNFVTKNHPWNKGIKAGEYTDETTGEVRQYFNSVPYQVVKQLAESHRLIVRQLNRAKAQKHKALETKLTPYTKGGKVDKSIPMPEHVKVTHQEYKGINNLLEFVDGFITELDTALEFFGGGKDFAHYDIVAEKLDERLTKKVTRRTNTSALRESRPTQTMVQELDEFLEDSEAFVKGESDVNPINQSNDDGEAPSVH
tara:strand:- start:491 stop:1174 length:684 start_codon:yes stop_codon:yes gene_type:complete